MSAQKKATNAKHKAGKPAKTPPPHGRNGYALASLTPREGEVLGWIVEGKRDGEIGTILGISANTVHKHAQRIYAKLEVETRTAAARHATEHGFVPPPTQR